MNPIIQAAFTTSLIYLISSWTGYKRNNSIYLTIFLLLSGIGYLFNGHLHAEQVWTHHIRSKSTPDNVLIVTGQETNDLKEKLMKEYRYHYKMCDECYEKAKAAIANFPSIDDQKKAQYCFKSSVASLGPGTLTHKLVYAILCLAADVGIDVMNEWNRINTFLMMSKSHSEMVSFYAAILNDMEREERKKK